MAHSHQSAGALHFTAHCCRRIQNDKSPTAAVSYIIPYTQFKRIFKAKKKKKKKKRDRDSLDVI